MSTTPVRASDAEREEVARVVTAAGGEGRLTLAETEERLTGIYSTRFRHELRQFTADLPAPPAGRRPGWPGRPSGPLAAHTLALVVIGTALIVRWLASGDAYFWPAFPMFWLIMTLVLHARARGLRLRYRGSTPA